MAKNIGEMGKGVDENTIAVWLTDVKGNPTKRISKKAKGMQRRRKFTCRECLNPILEFPALVMNKSDMVCEKCQKIREDQDAESFRLSRKN